MFGDPGRQPRDCTFSYQHSTVTTIQVSTATRTYVTRHLSSKAMLVMNTFKIKKSPKSLHRRRDARISKLEANPWKTCFHAYRMPVHVCGCLVAASSCPGLSLSETAVLSLKDTSTSLSSSTWQIHWQMQARCPP